MVFVLGQPVFACFQGGASPQSIIYWFFDNISQIDKNFEKTIFNILLEQ